MRRIAPELRQNCAARHLLQCHLQSLGDVSLVVEIGDARLEPPEHRERAPPRREQKLLLVVGDDVVRDAPEVLRQPHVLHQQDEEGALPPEHVLNRGFDLRVAGAQVAAEEQPPRERAQVVEERADVRPRLPEPDVADVRLEHEEERQAVAEDLEVEVVQRVDPLVGPHHVGDVVHLAEEGARHRAQHHGLAEDRRALDGEVLGGRAVLERLHDVHVLALAGIAAAEDAEARAARRLRLRDGGVRGELPVHCDHGRHAVTTGRWTSG